MTATTQEVTRAEVPPREELLRMSPFALRAADQRDDGDGLTLDGFAAVFNRETIIDSWEGRFKEIIKPGSMKRSFRESPPKIQFDHGRHPLIGSIPIAALRSIAEEVDPDLAPEGGAHVVGRLLDNWLVQPVRDAIAAEAVDGMSFRFTVMQERWYDAEGKQVKDEQELRELLRRSWYEEVPDEELLVRHLVQLKVPELGPVTWPAYGETSVSVRSQTGADERGRVVIDLAKLSSPDERSKLAALVLAADRAESNVQQDAPDDGTLITDAPDDSQRATSDEAGEHEEREDDTQQATETAGEHESENAEPSGLRSSMDRFAARSAVIVQHAMKREG